MSLTLVIAGPLFICFENGVPCQVESAFDSCCRHMVSEDPNMSYSNESRTCEQCKDTAIEMIAVLNTKDTNPSLEYYSLEYLINISTTNNTVHQSPEFDIHFGFVPNSISPQEPIHLRFGAAPLIC